LIKIEEIKKKLHEKMRGRGIRRRRRRRRIKKKKKKKKKKCVSCGKVLGFEI